MPIEITPMHTCFTTLRRLDQVAHQHRADICRFIFIREQERDFMKAQLKFPGSLERYGSKGLLKGVLRNGGFFDSIQRYFVLGEARSFATIFNIVHVRNNPNYPNGLALFDEIKDSLQIFDQSKIVRAERMRLVGDATGDLVQRAFDTYYGAGVSKTTGKDQRLLVYGNAKFFDK